jgi:hypothetical protein
LAGTQSALVLEGAYANSLLEEALHSEGTKAGHPGQFRERNGAIEVLLKVRADSFQRVAGCGGWLAAFAGAKTCGPSGYNRWEEEDIYA